MIVKKVTGIPEVDNIVAALGKKFDKDIFTLGPKYSLAAVFPSGSLALDVATGVGGIPKDKIIEIYGEESAGKTSLSLQLIKMYVDKYGYSRIPAYIDLERTTALGLIEGIGLDPGKMLFCYPDTAEEAVQAAVDLGLSNGIGIIGFDSVDAAQTEADVNRQAQERGVCELPRIMSVNMRKLSKICVDKQVCYLFVNQIRTKIGVMYGDPRITSGGKSLKYYASLRLEVSSKRSKEIPNLLNMKVKIIKNKLAPAGNIAEFNFICGKGTDTFIDTLNFAKDMGLLRTGSKYTYSSLDGPEEQICSEGKDGARQYLIDNPDYYNKLRETCLKISRDQWASTSSEEDTNGTDDREKSDGRDESLN